MGGAYGYVAVSIARRHPRLRFIVQDLGEILANAEEALPKIVSSYNDDDDTSLQESIASRITYMELDFLSGIQPVTGADVYMFRFVIHDWSDKYVVRILQNIVPSMKKKTARIVIMDYVLVSPGSGNNKVAERLERFSSSFPLCFYPFSGPLAFRFLSVSLVEKGVGACREGDSRNKS